MVEFVFFFEVIIVVLEIFVDINFVLFDFVDEEI